MAWRRHRSSDGFWAALADLMAIIAGVFILLYSLARIETASVEAELEQARQPVPPEEADLQQCVENLRGAITTILSLESRTKVLEKKAEELDRSLGDLDAAKRQLAALKGVIQADISTDGDVVIEDSFLFELGESKLKDSAKGVLGSTIAPRLALILDQYPCVDIYVIGHADSRPYPKFPFGNWQLSLDRSGSVLYELFGAVPARHQSRLYAIGRGDSSPLEGYRPDDERNRRVELSVRSNRNCKAGQGRSE